MKKTLHNIFGVKHHRLVPVVLVREVLFKEPALDRRQDDFALHRALVCLFAFGTLYILGKLLDRRMLEEIFHFQLPAVLIQAARHLNSFDGISAKREEIVGDTDFRHSKHVLPDAGKQLFHRRTAVRSTRALGSTLPFGRCSRPGRSVPSFTSLMKRSASISSA